MLADNHGATLRIRARPPLESADIAAVAVRCHRTLRRIGLRATTPGKVAPPHGTTMAIVDGTGEYIRLPVNYSHPVASAVTENQAKNDLET